MSRSPFTAQSLFDRLVGIIGARFRIIVPVVLLLLLLLLYGKGSITVVGFDSVDGVDDDGSSQQQVNDEERHQNRINPK